MNPRSLESFIRESCSKGGSACWTPAEVVYQAFQFIQQSGAESKSLKKELSPESYTALRNAAREVAASLEPDEVGVGIGWVTPEAPVQFTHIPLEFLSSLYEDEK